MGTPLAACAAAAALFTACLSGPPTPCADGQICGGDQACAPGGGCADPADIAACAALAAGAACQADFGEGICRGGVCRANRCGDDILDPGEVCDDGNLASGDGCSGDCLSDETCGNGRIDTAAGEECDDANPDDTDLCRTGCVVPRCGDGVIDPALSEGCDEGVGNSAAPDAACRINCQVARCGDGVRDPSREVCDDGNLVSGDGCAVDCASDETCGNARVDVAAGEGCDDGNDVDDDGCRNDCSIPGCGDGLVDAVNGEACDEGAGNSAAPNATCRPTCQLPRCGDGVHDDVTEVCDDGDLTSGDGCAADCLSDETCGNARVDIAAGEGCDDGNGVDDDGCRNDCSIPGCGDGVVDAINGEACDEGTGNSALPNAPCRPTCQLPRCGDGVHDDAIEACDDGGLASGDGCSADCGSTEACGNGIVDAFVGEACDEADQRNRDGCSSRCRRETLGWTKLPTDGQQLVWSDPVAYDVTHGEVVSVVLGDTGTLGVVRWRGRGWDRAPIDTGPGNRFGFAIAYDQQRRRLILFGGQRSASNELFNDTWAWDGATWQPVVSAVRPSARRFHAMAYDSTNGEVVMHGGQVGVMGTLADATTWVLGRDGWSARGAGPSPRLEHVVVDVPGHGVMLTGGVVAGGPLLDTWWWDGSAWRAGPTAPTSFRTRSATYDVSLRRLIVASGNSAGGVYAWSEATGWIPVGIAGTSPLGQSAATAVFDAARGEVLVLGTDNRQVTAIRANQWVPKAAAPVPPDPYRYATVMTDTGYWLRGSQEGLFEPWRLSAGTWEPLVGGQPQIPGRVGFAMATQEHPHILFGGYSSAFAGVLGETWQYIGSDGWVSRPQYFTASPQPRTDASMANHGGGALLFGGSGLAGALGDTWRWNGQWEELHPATSPSPRLGAQAVTDFARDRVVLVGGFDTTFLNETWEFDGATWSQRAWTGPAPRLYFGLAYDRARERTVLFGGRGLSQQDPSFDDIWEWDGAAWQQLAPSGPRPSARWQPQLAYNAELRGVLLVGGFAVYGVPLRDTWLWDGTQWTQLADPPEPPAATFPRVVYDRRRDRLIGVFGEEGLETWAFQEGAWRRLSAPLPGSCGACGQMVYDAGRDRVVRLDYAGLYEFDGQQWQLRSGIGGPTGSDLPPAYDEANRVVVFPAAQGPTGGTRTWTWDGTAWASFDLPATLDREGAAVGYDAAAERVVVFGGYDASTGTFFDDTWEWDGATWREWPATSRPPASSAIPASMSYAPELGGLVLLLNAGFANTTQVWVRRATTWVELDVDSADIGARTGVGAAYDERNHRVVLVGSDPSTARSDLWALQFTPVDTIEACTSGIDVDHDGAAGCADDECWAECTPGCPPDVSCPAEAPRCGDGLCQPLETERFCAVDCTNGQGGACGDGYCGSLEAAVSCPVDC